MTSRLKICVPSKGRATIFTRKTLAVLRYTHLPWSVFVEPQEEKEYRDIVGVDNLVVLGASDQGLGYSLNSIREHCIRKGYEFVWKMDDDIHHWYAANRVAPKKIQGEYLNGGAELLSKALAVFGKSLGGLSFSSNYFHKDWRDFTHVNRMFETTYIVRTGYWKTPLSLKGYHEEFIASAELLRRGLIIPHVGRYCWSADLSTLPGGLQSFDRATEQAEFYTVMEREFPELCRMTQRQEYRQKTGDVFTVTDKKVFNRRNSFKLPITKQSQLSKELLECLSELE